MRLVHQLSVLLMATVLLAVVAVAGVVVWNLRAGFSDYLRAQDSEHFTRLMEVAERDIADRGGPPAAWRPALRRWLDGSRPEPGTEAPEPPRPRPAPGSPRPLGGLDEPAPGEPPGPGQRPPRGDPANFGPRLALLSADGSQVLAGNAQSVERPGQTRALKRAGQTVAVLRLAERAGPAQGVDARFLRRQYLGLATAAAVVLGLAWLLARLFAVHLARPLREAQLAARRIADGDFAHRLPAVRPGLGRSAREIAELHADINGMAAALQTLESSRQRWIAELSHELRTPLAVLRGEVEALLDGIRPLDQRALASLQEEVRRLSRLVDDFHVLAVSDLRALPCDFAPVAPAALLAAALDRVAGRAARQGLGLTRELPAVLPAAHWDAGRIDQLLANLLENSLRYTTAPGQIRLSARALPGAIEVRLEDSPPGVTPAELERLFEPLYRVDASRSRSLGGSGLGLAIARAIARSHAGSLRAEASALGGLALVLTLPLQAGNAAGVAPA